MFSVEEIIKVTGGKYLSGPFINKARRVATDSRVVKKGDLFIAIKGDKFDAHDFVGDVMKKGVSIVLVQRPIVLKGERVTVICVEDTIKAMGQLAHYHRMRFNIPVIALTGSAGKTTTKEMLAAILKIKYNVLYNVRSFNNHIGVPLTLFQLKAKHEVVVLECGTNQPGDIRYLAQIAQPTVTVFTAIGESHLERLKTLAGVLKEKWQLNAFLPKNAKIFINGDDPLLLSKQDARCVSVGVKRVGFWQAKDIVITKQGWVTFKQRRTTVLLHTTGLHYVTNALLAIACGSYFKISLDAMVRVLSRFNFPQGRGQLKRVGSITVIDDAYNANPLSMRKAIELLARMPQAKRRVLVIGNMLELGLRAGIIHRELGKFIVQFPIDALITVGDLAKQAGDVAKKQKTNLELYHADNAKDALKLVNGCLKPHDTILIKGSHSMGLNLIVDALTKSKGK